MDLSYPKASQRMDQPTISPRKPRNDKRRERNRRQLIDATLELVAHEGRAALSVSRISRKAGIDPPNFYAHFKSVEECERAAAEALDFYLSRKLEPYARVRTSKEEGGAGCAHAALLASWLEEPRWCKLMLNARYDDESPIGERMRCIVDNVRGDTRTTLSDIAGKVGLLGALEPTLELLVELCVGHFMTAFEALAEGRLTDVEAAGAAIARANRAIVMAELKRLGEQPAHSPHSPATEATPKPPA
jgi:AcrR family transcriptional regulator